MPIGRTCLRGISTSLDASGKRVGRLDTFRICHMSGGANLDATERPVLAAARTPKRRGTRLSSADHTPPGPWLWGLDRVPHGRAASWVRAWKVLSIWVVAGVLREKQMVRAVK